MTDSNRLRLTVVPETTVGTTPGTPRMLTVRNTGESLSYQPNMITSNEIRSDRMNADPILVGQTNGGAVNIEFHYPVQNSGLDYFIASAMVAAWTNTPTRDNDGTADSVITDVAATTGVMTVSSTGGTFVVGHLIRNSNFTNSGNNGLFRITTGSATAPAVGASIFTNETAPPATARIKVVGFQGASGDITATATGLGSTTLDFTTLGIVAGQWLKISAEGGAYSFATAALADWVRVTAITATALTFDNRPSGWTTDSGTSKTIRVYFGDRIINGTTLSALTIERGFMGQGTPTYISQTGMSVNEWSMSVQTAQAVTSSFTFMGMSGAASTTSLDASPDAAPDTATYSIMAAGVNVGRVAEAGSSLSSPNWVRALSFRLNNNLAMLNSIDSSAAVGHRKGESALTVNLDTYFGSSALLAKLIAGTATSANTRIAKNSQAVVFTFPRLTYMSGNPNASGKNTDVLVPLVAQASYDSTTGAQMCVDRLEYYA